MIANDEGFEILDRATCLELLATVQVGRLAWATVDGRVNIRPVNYTLAGADIIVRTGMGSIFAAALADLPVTLEADDLEPALETGWSVVVIGTSEDLGSTTEAAALRESVRPLQASDKATATSRNGWRKRSSRPRIWSATRA